MHRRTARIITVAAATALAVAAPLASADTASANTPTTSSGAIQGTARDRGHLPPATVADLGPNVIVVDPSMTTAQIRAVFDRLAAQQVTNQFGPQRYAVLFTPGHYGTAADPLVVQVGYYTQVAGLGLDPGEVSITGAINVYNQCDATGCIALNNFWRSLSNLTITPAGGDGCRASTEFWAVSQAAPMRRVAVTGKTTLMDYCTAGPQFASGGFVADSVLAGPDPVINGSQQQWFTRNSTVSGWSNGVWNQVFSGVNGAPATTFGTAGANPYTTLPTTPVTRESPYPAIDADGTPVLVVPDAARGTAGPSWTADASGRHLRLDQLVVANPTTSAATMNRALAQGKSLILSPGVYHLDQPLRVTRPDTVVYGLGFATLVPDRGSAAIDAVETSGLVLSGIIVDAGPQRSDVLVRVGRPGQRLAAGRDHSSDHGSGQPALVSDVFLRVGGAAAGSTQVGLQVDASGVVLDDIWAWRADHGAGVGWAANTAATGVLVRGDDVTATGLFVEHWQRSEVVWSGERGQVVFLQNEKPYDVPDQAAWRQGPAALGYPALEVVPSVRTFTAWGLGSYSFFNQGKDIHVSNAFVVPQRPGVVVHDALTRFLDGSGGIDHVVDGVGAPVDAANPGPSQVVRFPG